MRPSPLPSLLFLSERSPKISRLARWLRRSLTLHWKRASSKLTRALCVGIWEAAASAVPTADCRPIVAWKC